MSQETSLLQPTCITLGHINSLRESKWGIKSLCKLHSFWDMTKSLQKVFFKNPRFCKNVWGLKMYTRALAHKS